MSGDDTYEVYAIRYAHHERRSGENYIGGDPHDVPDPLDYFVWAIVGQSGAIVVDTGFDEAMARKRNRTLLKPVAEGLKAVGVAPETVETVIVTHLHYDHAGNYDLFPRARYHLQDCEMAYATGRCMCHAALRLPFEVEDVVAMVRKVFAGRVTFHDGAEAVAPGVTVHKIGGHSRGLQCVRVNTRRGPVVLASDTSHLYAHFEQGRVFPITCNVAEVVEGYQTLRRLAPSPQHIVPGHDPRVMARYPAARDGLEGWVVRLDTEPKAA
ncbi:MAG TPA: N-acyl homoserine lactonase family protein [Xanthobacteraceae bacterium]|nr:N-acyl homoserine lactonase family protein [Xanthobacteraceae bacterium]